MNTAMTGLVVAALSPVLEQLASRLLGIVVEMVGGPDRVRAMLDAEYAAADAAVDLLEDAKVGPPKKP